MKIYARNFIFIVMDILVLIALFYLTLYIRNNISICHIPIFHQFMLKDFYFIIFIIIVLFYYEKIYTLQYDFWQETKKIFKALFLAYFIVLALLTLTKTSLGYSRLFISIYFLFTIFIIPMTKRFIKRVVYRFPFFKKKVLVIGDPKQVKVLKQELLDNWYLGMKSNEKEYESVIITSQGMSVDEVNDKITKYLQSNRTVYIVPYVININFANSNIMEYSNIRYSTIQVENKLLIKRNLWIKNIFDFVITLMILPLFLIIHTFIAFAIKLDSKGSIFFKQDRLGKDDNNFKCYKYRTMYNNSQNILKNYLKDNPDEIKYYKKYHKYKNDPRITKVGKFLRKNSLDELAQLINVLRGEMSLVGPRPYIINESDELGKNKDFILKVKPGITGLWQVSGRNNLTFNERNKLEVWYIKNWSLWTDFTILVKTIKVVLLKIGAR